MKIEETPFQFNGVHTVDTRLQPRHPQEFSFDDIDLSFLELLNTLPGAPAQAKTAAGPERKETDEPRESETKSESPRIKGHLRLVENQEPPPAAEPADEAQDAIEMLRSELTDIDVQYLKQVVIPGLPILMGSVPFNSIFPAGEAGGISYKGFDISPKLQELIEQGYKTGRPVRVELDKATAVVLKIRDGRVSAEFMSSDKTMALYMKQELDDLRHRMAMRNLPVGTLEYRDHDSRRQQHSRNNDEDAPF